MSTLLASENRGNVAALGAIGAAFLLVAAAAVAEHPSPKYAAPAAIVLVLVSLSARALLRWRSLMASIVLCILLIPMRKYSLPGHLPVQLEPYRLLVAVIAFGWISALLVDPRVRVVRCGLEAPLLLIAIARIGSDAVNFHSISSQGLDSYVIKALSFFASFVILLYMVVGLTKTRKDLDFLIKILVGGAAFVAASSTVEDRVHYNLFDHLHSLLPILQFSGLTYTGFGDSRVRAVGSAEHPIALGAGLALVLPLALYLLRATGQKRWAIAAAILTVGALSSRSRTPMLMLVVIAIVFLWLRPRQVRRYWPALIPILFVAQVAMPGLTSTLAKSFFPKGGLIGQQREGAGTYGSGRVADLGPGLKQWRQNPVFGLGFGARVTNRIDPHWNAPILDDQWLGTLLETGLVGALAWVWLLVRSIRRFARAAKEEPGPRGLLFVALAAAVAAYAESMATYDAFSFTQEVFILFVLLAIGSTALRLGKDPARSGRRVARP